MSRNLLPEPKTEHGPGASPSANLIGWFRGQRRAILAGVTILLASGALTFVTVKKQVDFAGPYFLFKKNRQLWRHAAVIKNEAKDPWQYRILSEYTFRAYYLFEQGRQGKSPREFDFVQAMVRFRRAQNFLLLLLCAAYFRRLGAGLRENLLLLSMVAWAFTWAVAGSDLSFNLYFDLTFYLLCGLAILYRKDFWIPAIGIVAAFNRETSLLMPLLLLFARVNLRARWLGLRKKTLILTGSTAALQVATYLGIRRHFGPKEPFYPYDLPWGIDLLKHNITSLQTWEWQLATFAVVPIVGLLNYRCWRPEIRSFFWALVPVWTATHAAFAMWEETRLFLVPYILVALPAALLGLTNWQRTAEVSGGDSDTPRATGPGGPQPASGGGKRTGGG